MTAVDLVPSWVIGSIDLTSYPFAVDADSTVEIGEPEMVVESVVSQLADGDPEKATRHGNRTYVLTLYVEGATLGDLADSEALLRTELQATGLTLTHDPGDGLTPASVYEVWTASLKQERDDTHESHLIRRFTLTLTCTAFARSVEATAIDALDSGTSSVVVDTCDSTTGWTTGITANPDALSASSGAVWSTDSAGGDDRMSLYRAAAIDVSAHPYFRLEWKASPTPGYMILGLPAADDPFPSELRRVALSDGWFRSTWLVEPGDLDSGFQFSYARTTASSVDSLGIREVSKSDIQPSQTPRQLTRIVEAGGTERTPVSLHVQTSSGTGALTQAIVHTCPEDGSGYSPPLRRWKVSGQTTVADSSLYSGEREPIAVPTDAFFAEVPTSSLPEGGYTLVARVRMAASPFGDADIYYSVSTKFPDSTTREGYVVDFERVTFTDTNWKLVALATLSLPTVRTKAGWVQVALSASIANSQIDLDEAWLFREEDDCALTIVDTARPHLWCDSPDVSSPVPTVWVGDGSSTRVHPGTGLRAQGAHILHPAGTAVFTAALSDNPKTDATFYRRWHSNAAS